MFQTPGTDISSKPGTDKRLAQRDFARATLVLSKEQTVNVCLENLLIALFNVMGYYGRMHEIVEPSWFRKTMSLIYIKHA